MTEPVNHFARLNAIDVSKHIEKKGGFSYLSWPYAVAQLRQADPTACWEVRRFDGLPYLVTPAGVFVEVAVTVQGITMSQIHPVLNGRNQPLYEPNSFDINSSIQRCLVKAIALHGLGLYIYAGEDLPQPATDAANDSGAGNQPEPHGETRQFGPAISGPQQAQIHKLVISTGTDLNRLLAHFGISHLKDLPKSEYIRVIRTLEQRKTA